ncbi:TPA: sarcinarray family MAST domain-containing protein [Methanosarcinaceae archaeon]|nr:sarcinarray family MAST domain-containing protein [Methanosarcinaceae archaeon]
MKTRNIIFAIIISFLFLQSNVTATSPHGKIDVYYNDEILPGEEIATPTLKIGEPFNIKANVTVYKEYKVSGQLSEIGNGNFEVVEGPSQMNQYSSIIVKPNESHIFEWTVKPTEGWAGGSLPINFHYALVEKGNPEPVLNSGFTVAYCTISTEYYEGKIPSQESSSSEPKTSSESTPAFTTFGTFLAVALAASRN